MLVKFCRLCMVFRFCMVFTRLSSKDELVKNALIPGETDHGKSQPLQAAQSPAKITPTMLLGSVIQPRALGPPARRVVSFFFLCQIVSEQLCQAAGCRPSRQT